MDVLVLIGRIVFASLFFLSAINHLTKARAMGAYARSKGIPAPEAAVFGSGLLMLLGSLSVAFGIWPDLGALLLLIFLLPTAFLMHNFWAVADPAARQNDMLHFHKDLALAGAALVMLGTFADLGGDLGLTLTKPLFG
ncbi:DoxX family membrane protein [Streptomyces hoynatensis]|uniref:DoxX family membrane protein n=1 Tax=Streptomyces hoynatensis TaxID=1141874 RepID=A0A3A9Z3G4_9ACTN|nr:DoxX family membrane protein [Streptomyces hoynatensis]RKN42991.1 DoxX family membrane protein [Streptomyces hoynatensis]